MGRPSTVRAVGLAVALAMLLTGCARLGPGVSGVVDRTQAGSEDVRFVYLGSGGWIMEYQGEIVLTAPLFTNPDFVRTGMWKIEADTVEIDRYMSQYDVRSARVILSGHGHYDHLMDVPRVAGSHAPTARIAGSRTVSNLLGTWAGVEQRIDIINDAAGDQETVGQWLTYGR